MEFLEKITPREYQEKIFETCINKNCLVVLPTGLGKCLEFSQLILMKNGTLTKIGELFEKTKGKIIQNKKEHIIKRPSEKKEVISLNNNLKLEKRKIVAIHKIKTKEPLLKIIAYSGAEIIVTPEHPFLTLNNKLEWKRADKFNEGEPIATPSQLPEPKNHKKIDIIKIFQNINSNMTCYVELNKKFSKKNNLEKKQELKNIINKKIEKEDLINNIKYFYIKGSRANPTKIKNTSKLSPKLLYWVGLLIAEGRVHGGIKFYNNNKYLLNLFTKLSKNLFGISPRKIKGGLKLSSTALYFFVRNIFEMNTNQHSRDKKISSSIMNSPNKSVASFISALYDGEGSIRKNGVIEFMTASKELANNLCYLLLRFNIKGRITEKICSATNSQTPKKRFYYRIYIQGKKDLKNFDDKIGFKHKEKQRKLKDYLSKNINYNPNVNLIPISGSEIRQIRNFLKLSSTKWKDFEIAGIDTYERNERRFSHETLRKTIKGFENKKSKDKQIKDKINFLKELLNSHIYWDKIKKIEKIKENWVYDISLDKNFNFIAGRNGGFIAHNTLIALMLSIERMKKFPGERVVFLAPTRPLAEQHLNYFKKNLPELFGEMQLFTGSIISQKRKEIWETTDIIFSTPQCIANDLKKGLYDLNNVCLLIEDEAHRCTKNYDYNYISKKYQEQANHPRILGLTASPGSKESQIKEICKNLSIEEVELRTRESSDVKEYLQELEFEKKLISLPEEFLKMKNTLLKLFTEYTNELKKRRILWTIPSKTELIRLQKRLLISIIKGNKNYNNLMALSTCAQAIKIHHAIELLETQTLFGFNKYLKKLLRQAAKKESRGVVKLVAKPEFNYVLSKSDELLIKGIEHPKIPELTKLVKKEHRKDSKIIIFTQFRDTAKLISKKINEISGINSKIFVGQLKKISAEGVDGLSQKEQKKILQEFSSGEVNVLCATSVGEEGLDIPEVNTVIFYEPVPSAIRSIQRAGRTARLMKGKLIILITQKTKDEAYFYISKAKEKQMHSAIKSIKESLSEKEKGGFAKGKLDKSKQKKLE